MTVIFQRQLVVISRVIVPAVRPATLPEPSGATVCRRVVGVVPVPTRALTVSPVTPPVQRSYEYAMSYVPRDVNEGSFADPEPVRSSRTLAWLMVD